MCLLPGCAGENERPEEMGQNGSLSDIERPLLSYGGNYEAVIEEFDDDGVKCYKLYILDINGNDLRYEAKLSFRARDKNLNGYLILKGDFDFYG
jgi:hypothetical protein